MRKRHSRISQTLHPGYGANRALTLPDWHIALPALAL
jgi:hypothetical protein